METEVPRVYFQRWERETADTNCRTIFATSEGEDKSNDIAESIEANGDSDKGAQSVPDGLVRLLCISRDEKCVSRTGCMDKKKAANVQVETVEVAEDKGERTDFIGNAEA